MTDLIASIRADLAAGMRGVDIAKKHGINRQTVSRVRTGKQDTMRGPRSNAKPKPVTPEMREHKYHAKVVTQLHRIVRHDGVVLAGSTDAEVLQSACRCICIGQVEGYARVVSGGFAR